MKEHRKRSKKLFAGIILFLLLYSNIDNVDPESVFAVDNGNIGFEWYGSPQARSFGFNVNFRF